MPTYKCVKIISKKLNKQQQQQKQEQHKTEATTFEPIAKMPLQKKIVDRQKPQLHQIADTLLVKTTRAIRESRKSGEKPEEKSKENLGKKMQEIGHNNAINKQKKQSKASFVLCVTFFNHLIEIQKKFQIISLHLPAKHFASPNSMFCSFILVLQNYCTICWQLASVFD